jgi:hypothetical protein
MGRKLMALDREITQITQLPAIVKSGAIEILSADLLKLQESDLKNMAMVMGGTLVYMKLRATYTELEVSLCGFDNCYNPTHDLWCDDHAGGHAKARPRDNG